MEIFNGKLPAWAVLLIIALIGLIGIAFSSLIPWLWLITPIHELSIAFFIASILGFTIDYWIKDAITRDVFEAAFGYFLPKELKEEIRWIADQRFLATRSICHIKLEKLRNNKLRMTGSLERELKNITAHTHKLPPAISIDEWGDVSEPSKIIKAIVKVGDKTINYNLAQNVKKTSEKISVSASDEISVKPGAKVTFITQWSEIKTLNDVMYMTYTAPTLKSEVEVTECPPNIEHTIEHSHRVQDWKEYQGTRRTLDATLLPTQHIRVRWWPKQ